MDDNDKDDIAGNADVDVATPEAILAQIERHSSRLIKQLPALGPTIMLYLQSPHRRFQFIGDLEWLLLPPLVNRQCKLYMTGEYPVSFVSWALLDEQRERHLLCNGGRLRPNDWSTGDRLWIIDIVAPFGGVSTVLSDIRKMFTDRHIRMLVPDPATGGVAIRIVEPLSGPEKGHANRQEMAGA